MRPILSITVAVFIFANAAQATDRIYTLAPDTPFDDSPFGFSGTITTDGSTGYFSDVGFIKDWSITVHTPSNVDGVTTEVFTRASGPPIQVFASTGSQLCDCIRVTESNISIDAPNPPLTNLVIAIGVAGVSPTSISWIGPYFTLTGRPREVRIFDVGENPEWESRMFGSLSSLPFAEGGVVIPEPSTGAYFVLGLFGLLVRIRRPHPKKYSCSNNDEQSPSEAQSRGGIRFASSALRPQRLCVSLLSLVAIANASRADIFQWEYIDPADPSQGKRQSTTLAAGGNGVDAVPWSYLVSRNLTMAYLNGADLTGADGYDADFTDADMANANLTDAFFLAATLTGADFAGAEVRGANFGINHFQLDGTGITLAQLYSTASYQSQDLSEIDFTYNNLAGANFADQKLTNANFRGGTLTDADFSGAEVRAASFYKDFHHGTGITLAQIYSTASYQAHDLSGIELAFNNLSGGNFAGQDFTGANLRSATLTGANVRQANLNKANFEAAILTGADLTGTEIREATFANSTLTVAQLYSTANYQAKDLSRIDFAYNNLNGGNFAGQNLATAGFLAAELTSADFRKADLANAYFALAALNDANFSQANLTHASFYEADVSGVNFTGAEVRGADLDGAGITLAQLYSTASYQAGELSGIRLGKLNLAGGDFVGKTFANASFGEATLSSANFREANLASTSFVHANLAGADFDQANLTNSNLVRADLTGANLRNANLANATFFTGGACIPGLGCFPTLVATLTGADLTAADARGSHLGTNIADATTTNLIRPDGHIHGLDLDSDGLLVVRDYETQHEPVQLIPIIVDQQLMMGPGGTLRMVFEADAWDSTISFAPGIPVTLGGTLELTFAADVNVASQLGRTFDIFDWTGVTPNGAFDVSSPYDWDVSNLYTTGEVTLTAVPEPSCLALVLVRVCSLVILRREAKPRIDKKEAATLPRSG